MFDQRVIIIIAGMNCIYQRSKYYQQARLDPLQIVEPIGYNYLNQQQQSHTTHKKKQGELIIKHLHLSSLTKRLSQNSLPFRELDRILKISQSTQRKNFNLNGKNLQFMSRELTKETLQDLQGAYFPQEEEKKDLLLFLELLGAISVLREVIFAIRDYSLSTYLVYYQGQNLLFYNYLQKLINQEFIEYDNQILINSPQLSRPQLRKIDYKEKYQVENYIDEMVQIGKEKDPLFGGIHLYISDTTPEIKDKESALREETELWTYLLSQITIITSILNEGQHAILKIGGTYTQKTIQYIYLLRMAFNRVSLHKNILSNPFSNDKFLICEGFNKDNGQAIAKFLLNNFETIQKEGENILLVELKAIYANDFHTNVNDFNNLSPIVKTSKEVLKDFNDNCNTVFYPNPENLNKRLEELRLFDLQEVKSTLEKMIPASSQQKKTQKEPLIEKKEAEVIDFDNMISVSQPAKTEAKKDFLDLSTKKEDPRDEYIEKYLSNGDKILKKRKEKEKEKQKARKKKREEAE